MRAVAGGIIGLSDRLTEALSCLRSMGVQRSVADTLSSNAVTWPDDLLERSIHWVKVCLRRLHMAPLNHCRSFFGEASPLDPNS